MQAKQPWWTIEKQNPLIKSPYFVASMPNPSHRDDFPPFCLLSNLVTCGEGWIWNFRYYNATPTSFKILNAHSYNLLNFTDSCFSLRQDLLIHVRDCSHPEFEAQKAHVLDVLKMLKLPKYLLENIIEVHNKVDLRWAWVGNTKASREETCVFYMWLSTRKPWQSVRNH